MQDIEIYENKKELGRIYLEEHGAWIEAVLIDIKQRLNEEHGNKALSIRRLYELQDFFLKYAEKMSEESSLG